METYDIVIIGAGPAGITSAIYASRAGLNYCLIEKGPIGGKVINAYEMLKQISGKIEGEYLLEVYGDNVIPENNGLYHISGGSCRKMVQKNNFSDSLFL